MKSFLVAVLLAVSLAFVLADPSASSDEKEDKAIRECNVTNPVLRAPSEVIVQGITSGDVITLSQEEKCNLYCFLQKVNFFDENGDIHGTGLVNHTLREAPTLAKYSDVIITQTFQIIRSTKGVQDKCLKAVISFHQYIQNIFTLALADGLQNFVDVRGKIVKAIAKNEPLPAELEKKVKEFLQLIDVLIKALSTSPPEKILASTSTPKYVFRTTPHD